MFKQVLALPLPALFFALSLFASASIAAPTTGLIRIGQTAGFSGTVAASVQETASGAKLYFDAVNAKGGINGQKIELVSLDDKFDPELARQNARTLIDQGVLCLFLTRGTPQNQAILPLLAPAGIALVAPSTGAMVLHEPVNPWIFNVRATYQREAEQMVSHLSIISAARIAVVQVDDSFGADAAAGLRKGFAKAQLQPVVYETYDRTKPDFKTVMPKIMKADAQAVIFIGSGTAVTDGMKALRAAGSQAQMLTLSNNASSGFVKSLGEVARGTIVSQVLPSERAFAIPIVKEVNDLARPKNLDVTPALLEGFASAKVLVEGLRRAGPVPTRASLRAGLETLNRLNIGGLDVSYGPNDHTGLDFSELAIIGSDGKFRR